MISMNLDGTSIWLLLDSRTMGGIETHVIQLARLLAEVGMKPSVVRLADHGPHSMDAQLDALNIPVRVLSGGLRSLFLALRTSRPDMIHTHGYKAGIQGRLVAGVLGIPVVSSYHAGEKGTGRVRFYDWLDRMSAQSGHPVAVDTRIARRIPGGVPIVPNFVYPPVEQSTGNRIAFVGRLSPEKGADRLPELAGALPGMPIDIYGDGPLRAVLDTHKTGLRLHGMVADMSSCWPDIGLLIMPSRHEGLPMAALEAMAAGVPVAAFAVGGLAGLIEDGKCGFALPEGDVSALAGAILYWKDMGADDRAAMSVAARERVLKNYGPTSAWTRWRTVYIRALEKKKR